MLPKNMRSLPYLLHTNRELGLMLAGKKPLAFFADGKDCFPGVMIRYLRLFDRQVEKGALVRADHYAQSSSVKSLTLHRILFALPGEEWRIAEMLELHSSDDGWTLERERREGELLGYEDWMNDYWLEQICGK
ncbi:MAG: hypothetical protein AB7G24_03105 [Novosphingobium sp.]